MESYYPTVENTFSRVIRYKNHDYATEIVDTAGQVRGRTFLNSPRIFLLWHPLTSAVFTQDEYSILNSKHFIGIHGYMLVYSVASKQSFEMISIIRDKILNHLVRWSPPRVPKVSLLMAGSNRVPIGFHSLSSATKAT